MERPIIMLNTDNMPVFCRNERKQAAGEQKVDVQG